MNGQITFTVGDVLAHKHGTVDKPKKYWCGPIPKKCDICGEILTDVWIDGRTIYGPWADMCRTCHGRIGCGVGVGNGQMYDCREKKLRG